MRILGFLVFLSIAHVGFGQIDFFYLYTSNGDDSGQGIVQLPDSSYVITGSSSGFDVASSQAFILRIDSLGNYLSSTSYGGAESEVGRRILYKENVGFYIAGYSNSYGAGDFDFYLVKTDEAGNELWSKTYGGNTWDRLWDAAIMPDTGVMMIGETASASNDNQDIYIVRTDKNGDTLWTKTLGTDLGDDYLHGMTALTDSVFLLVGTTYVPDSLYNKALVLRMRENGTIEFSDTMPKPGNTYFHDVDIRAGVQIIAVGHANGPSTMDDDPYYADLNFDGSHNFSYIGGLMRDQQTTNVCHYGTGTKWFFETDYIDDWSFPDGMQDITISRYSSLFAWEANAVNLNFPKTDTGGEVIPTNDGGAIFVGKTSSEGTQGVHHVIVAKLGPNDTYPDGNYPHTFYNLVSLKENAIEDGLMIYPNPANDVLIVKSSLAEPINLRLTTSVGTVVMSNTFYSETTIDVSLLSAGVYYLTSEVNDGSRTRKIVVSH